MNLGYFDMKFYKKLRLGVSILFLLLIFSASISLFRFTKENNEIDENSISISGIDDNYEPNNIPLSAYDLSSFKDVWLSNIDGSGILEDDDFYKINITMGQHHLKVNLSFNHVLGNIDVEIWDSGAVFLTGGYSLTDDEYIDYVVPSDGIYYIRVFGPNSSNIYDLLWKSFLDDDKYEENDDWSSAYDLTAFMGMWLSSLDGSGIQSDDDFFIINIASGFEHLIVDLMFIHSTGDIDLEVWDSTLVAIAWSDSVDDNEYIEINVPNPGTYYLRLHYGNMGNSYDLKWSATVPVDDNYEVNDDWTSAYDLSTWAASWLPFGQGTLFNEDWFKIYLDPGEERVKADLTFNHFAGNINMELYDWNNLFIIGSYSFDDNEYLDVTVPSNGTYYLRIFSPDPYTGNAYDLWWEDLTPTGGDDWMEENDDFWSAWWVNPNYYSGLKILGIDEDWFHTYLNLGDTINVELFFNHFDGDLQLELFDPSNTHRIGSYSGDNDEHISFTADISGDWRFRVYHAIGNSDVDYDLNIWIAGATPTGDDWMEENDGFWSAWGVSPNYYPDLIVIGNDEDWFQLYLNDGDVIDVRIFFDDNTGNLELELYDPLYNSRDGSYSSSDDEFISYAVDMSGNWRIRVYHEDGNSNAKYDLDIWIKDDYYESNNDLSELHEGHPSVLVENERTWLSNINGLAIQGDDDWYVIEATPGFRHLLINVRFNHTAGNIDVSIYDKHGSYILGNNSLSDDEQLDYTPSSPGIFHVKVHGENKGNEYDLWWDDLRTDVRPDDAYEMNNIISTAYDLHSQNIPLWQSPNMGLGLQYDNDWYEIHVEEGFERLYVWLIYDSAEGMIGFRVYDENNNEITGNFTLTDNDYIDYAVPSSGTYYIRVFGDNTGNVYNLWWFTEEYKGPKSIPGYNVLFLIGSIVGITTIVIKMKRSKSKHK